jgi:hypothetical protein
MTNIILARIRDFSFLHSIQTISGAMHSLLSTGKKGLPGGKGVKWPDSKTDHSPPSSTEVKYARS